MECDLAADAIFSDLEGSWTLDRRIEGIGTMQGQVTFRRICSDILEYREEGQFTLDSGSEFNAFRTLFFYRENCGISVRFRQSLAEQDILFRLEVEAEAARPWPTVARDEHRCGRDTYLGSYTFEAPGRMRTRVDVTGPSKNSCIETVLSKVA